MICMVPAEVPKVRIYTYRELGRMRRSDGVVTRGRDCGETLGEPWLPARAAAATASLEGCVWQPIIIAMAFVTIMFL